MRVSRILSASFMLLILVVGVGPAKQTVMAQSTTSAATVEKDEDETNLDTQLYLLVATNQEVDDAKLPAALDGIIRQLRASLPFKNYRLAATLFNRVKNDGRLNLKWIGGPLIVSGAAATTATPTFNEFHVNGVKLVRNENGRLVVRMEGFSFGARIPIQSGTAIASNGPVGPIINYEPTGLNTDISMPEGQPVIVGTLNVGPSGDAIILVMSAQVSGKR